MSQANLSKSSPLISFASTAMQAKPLSSTCFHCGLNCANTLHSEGSKNFCCAGCLLVFQFLNNQGMQGFYQIKEHPGNTVKEVKAETYYFEYLDDAELFNKIIDYQFEKIAVITLKIPGIHCASCIWLLENLHQLHDGIKKVNVNFLKKQARIHLNVNEIKLSQLAMLLDKIGYAPEFSWKHFKKGASKSNRQDVIKLGIAGFCFGNVMMLSFPEYISKDVPPQFKVFFGFVCLILSLPVILYSSKDWFIGAVKAMKMRRLTLDIPIVIGLMVLFFKSSYDVLINGENGYFDSLCGFIFFMLLARFFQKITFDKLSFTDGILSYFPMAVTIKLNDQFHTVPFTKIKAGDELFIRNSEIIPVESVLESENGLIDYSYLSGESELVSVSKKMILQAGGKISGKAVIVKANKPVEGNLLEQIWEDSNRDQLKDQLSFADRISPYFVITVTSIAALTFIFHLVLGNSISHALFCFASVLIITCPCALAISAPLVAGVIQRRLAKLGFFVRNGQVLERLSEVDTIVFDKTGTLTISDKEITPIFEELTEFEKSAVGALATNSIHPVSKQLSKWNKSNLEISQFEEIVGCGIEGICLKNKIKIGRYLWFKDSGVDVSPIHNLDTPFESLLCISINNKIKGLFSLQDKFRNNYQTVLTSLKKNYELHLISGDQDKEKEKIENIIQNQENVHFYFTPSDKQNYISSLVKSNKKVVMIGDGLNDQQALRASHVGIAVSESAGHFSPASDIILLGEKFEDLPYFIKVARKAAKLIRINFGFSLLYNILGVSIAVSGMLTPLVAAILMPLSSLTVVFVAVFGSSFLLRRKGKI